MIWGVLSLYKDFVLYFCEVSLCFCESKKTINLTDPTRSLPCVFFTALHFPLPVSLTALYLSLLYCPVPALYSKLKLHQNGQWVTKRPGGYRLGYRLASHLSNQKIRPNACFRKLQRANLWSSLSPILHHPQAKVSVSDRHTRP